MALSINNATYGYDANNLQQTINNLNINCIQKTINDLNKGILSLRATVDGVWKGQSAEKFKEKLESDANSVSKTISDLGDSLTSSMQSFVNNLAEIDNNISF